MIPAYNIAVLGFGSLPNQISSENYGNLKPDSPFVKARGLKVPVRIGRLSKENTEKRRFTAVICKGASDEPAFYALSKFSN